jgi:hypothetical protein
MTDDDLGRFAPIPEVLRGSANRGKGMHFVPLTNLRPSADSHMRQQSASFAYRDMLTDQAERPDLHVISEVGLGMDNRCWMNLQS